MNDLEEFKQKNKELENDKEILKDKLDEICTLMNVFTSYIYKIETICKHEEI